MDEEIVPDPRLSSNLDGLRSDSSCLESSASLHKDVRVFWTHEPLLERMRPILRMLQFLSLYPLPLHSLQSFNRLRTGGKTVFFVGLLVGVQLVNAFCATINVTVLTDLCSVFGILSARTMTSIVTGMKPIINLVNLSTFGFLACRHRILLRHLMMVDNNFASTFDFSPDMLRLKRHFFVLMFVSFLIPLALRLSEYIMMGEAPLTDVTNDLSVFIVPFLTVWNVLPLAYFYVVNSMARQLFEALNQALQEDFRLVRRNLRFYYRQFVQLTQLLQAIGRVFNPFIFFTIAWTVLTLCLTIYFVIQVKSFAAEPETLMDYRQFLFNMIYCCHQVVLAFVYLCALCIIGTKTNETARSIAGTLFSLQPVDSDPADRFQMVCFMQKIQVQYIWGISVWKAVPIERSLLFTLFSAIITYGLLLMKLKGSDDPLFSEFGWNPNFLLDLRMAVLNSTCLSPARILSLLVGNVTQAPQESLY